MKEWWKASLSKIPELFVTRLKKSGLKADVFTFAQRPPEITPRYDYHWEWDNWAAIPTACFKGWWENLPQVSRKNVRRSARRGVVVKVVPFDENLVKGVHRIYTAYRYETEGFSGTSERMLKR